MDESSPSSRTTWAAALLVFLSGFCALIYQVVWTRELRFVFGASTAASSAVIAIFIGGLGFGGLWFGRRVELHDNALRLYARLELAIAAFTAATPLLLSAVRALYVATGGSIRLGVAGSTLIRLALAALVLGPPTFLMGGTLPAIARAVERESDRARRRVALLYGSNTLGAVLGCGLTTFVWLERFGSRTTLYLACALNVTVGVAAYLLSKRSAVRAAAAGAAREDALAASEEPRAPKGFIAASAAVVGFAFFLMELVWYRILQPVLGGTIFTFGLILALALLGIGIGSTLYAALFSARRAMLLGFALTCVAEAVCMAVPFALGDRLAIWAVLLRPLGNTGFAGLVFGWSWIAGLVVLPAAIVAGFQFPLLIALLGRGRTDIGRDVGTAYASNTLGAVLGALCGGFGLLPALGALGCWRLAAGTLLVWGGASAVVALKQPGLPALRRSGGALALVLSLLAAALLAAPGPTAVLRQSPIGVGRVPIQELSSPTAIKAWVRRQSRMLPWQTDGKESAIGISRHDGISVVVNGKSDGNAITDAPTQVMGGLVAAALKPRVDKAMVIGLGTGSTAGWLAQLPEIRRVDVVELEPAVVEVARQCALVNERALDNDKVRIFRGDGRELLAVARARYDVIFSEPSNPYRAGVASLYTREFYRAIKRRLARDGIFVQWLQAYDVDARTLRTVYATLQSVFPHVETFYGHTHDLFLLARREEPVHDVDALAARLAEEPFKRALRVSWFTEGVEGFFAHYLANPAFARALSRKAPINTDDRTEIEFGFARNAWSDTGAAADALFAYMRAREQHRPRTSGRPVDWARVDYEREAFATAVGSRSTGEQLTPVYESRLHMLRRWMQSDLRGAMALLDPLGDPMGSAPLTMIDRMALAEIHAYAGYPNADERIRAFAADWPTLRLAMHSVWLMQNGDAVRGTDELVLALESYRRDPWPLSGQMARVLGSLKVRSEQDKQLAPRWLAGLAKPFAVYANELIREQARLTVAHGLGASHPACVAAFADMEPHVTWTEPVLSFRADCYREHAHPLWELAEAELAEFQAMKPPISFEQVERDRTMRTR